MAARRCSCTRCLKVNDATTLLSLCHDRRRHGSGGGTPRAGSTSRCGKWGCGIARLCGQLCRLPSGRRHRGACGLSTAGRACSRPPEAGGRSYVGKVLLFGLEGEINVNGNAFAGAMPAWEALSDNEIADVLNYVSNAWDNGKSLPSGFKPFTSDEINALRTPPLTSAAVYALRSGAPAGGAPATATASGAGGTAPVSFTADQVGRGSDIYADRCVQCHGDTLDNGEFGGAPLNGKYFKQHWGGGSVAALIAYMKAKMPPDRPGSLTDQSYADLASFLLDANDYPKGDKEL